MDTEEYYGGTYHDPPEYEEQEPEHDYEGDLADTYYEEKGLEEYLKQLEELK